MLLSCVRHTHSKLVPCVSAALQVLVCFKLPRQNMDLRPGSSALDSSAGLVAVEKQSKTEWPAQNGPESCLLDSLFSSLGSPRETGMVTQSTGLPGPNPTLPPTATTPDAQQLDRFASLPEQRRPVADPECSLLAATCPQTCPSPHNTPIPPPLPTVKTRPAAGSQACAVVPAPRVSQVRFWGPLLLFNAERTHEYHLSNFSSKSRFHSSSV